MEFVKKKREALPLTNEELEIVVKGLDVYYEKVLRKIKRLAKHDDDDKGRSIKESQTLARIQECLQYVTLIRNIRINKLNPDIAAAAGLKIGDEEENTSSTRESEHQGSEGTSGLVS